jgi:predicted small secreted protein
MRVLPTAVLAASLLLTGCAAGAGQAASGGQSDSAAPGTSPSPIAVATSSTSSTSATAGNLTAGQAPEALARNYLAFTTAWVNAGATEETRARRQQNAKMTLKEFSSMVAGEEAPKFAVALFGPDYQSDPTAKTFVENGTSVNAAVIEAFLHTNPKTNQAVSETYKLEFIFKALTSSETLADVTTLKFEALSQNNSSKAPGVLAPVPDKNVTYTVKFRRIGDAERLFSINTFEH